jgi:hypothetical protein
MPQKSLIFKAILTDHLREGRSHAVRWRVIDEDLSTNESERAVRQD